jgi:hypothetical protein
MTTFITLFAGFTRKVVCIRSMVKEPANDLMVLHLLLFRNLFPIGHN